MAHARGGRFQRTSGVRRETAWTIGPQEVDGSHSSTSTSLWSGTVVPAIDGLTIIRIRGFVRALLQTATAAGDGFFGAFGIGIATDAAIAVGVTAVPTPLTEEQWDGWLWHSYFDVRSVTATIADGVNAAGATVAFEIDSKAMRKFPTNMTLYGATEVVESGTALVELQGQTRMLVKLP